jgi:hypothetical protein
VFPKVYDSPALRGGALRPKFAQYSLARGQTCPWLSWPAILLIVAIMCAPLLCVEIPPLVDVPGHTGAAAIERAEPGSALRHYYAWHWTLTPNMGGQILMHIMGGGLASGWWTTLLLRPCRQAVPWSASGPSIPRALMPWDGA